MPCDRDWCAAPAGSSAPHRRAGMVPMRLHTGFGQRNARGTYGCADYAHTMTLGVEVAEGTTRARTSARQAHAPGHPRLYVRCARGHWRQAVHCAHRERAGRYAVRRQEPGLALRARRPTWLLIMRLWGEGSAGRTNPSSSRAMAQSDVSAFLCSLLVVIATSCGSSSPSRQQANEGLPFDPDRQSCRGTP